MKKTYYFLLAMLMISLSCKTENKNAVEGTWELVSAKYTSPDTTYLYPKSEFDHVIKIIGKTHFLFISQDTSRIESYDFGGGTYTLEGDTYTENIVFFKYPGFIGQSISYNNQIEGDNWVMTGPLNKKENEDFKWAMHEVWKRIE